MCGTPNDTRKASKGNQGDGLVEVSGSSPAEWDAAAGCHFCGSLQWVLDGSALPDDRFLPTPEIKRNKWR